MGAPPGYVGYEEGGLLTEKVRRRPYWVVLFDEIEKAHPDVFNMLLQVLDDGRFTDSVGHVVDFKNTILIMTSNLGTSFIGKRLSPGFLPEGEDSTHDKMKERVLEELKRAFRPEFINRIDDTIVFHALSKEDITSIVRMMVNRINTQLARRASSSSRPRPPSTFWSRRGTTRRMGLGSSGARSRSSSRTRSRRRSSAGSSATGPGSRWTRRGRISSSARSR